MNKIINSTNSKKYHWGINATAFELLETENLSVKFEIIPSNETEQLHYHNQSTQCFCVIKGIAKFLIDNNEFALKANDSITIFPKQIHLVRNEENEELHLLVISNPSTKNDRQNITDI
jgi:mannose-6-phosphate isomerase-like protein (cupin superfamily)